MSRNTTCSICQGFFDNIDIQSGTCQRCLESTAGRSGTPSPLDALGVSVPTGTYSPDGSAAATRPQPPTPSSARVDRLATDYGFTNIVRFNRGGMGDLYHAWSPQLGQPVVIKFVRAELRSPANIRRFKTESGVLERLGHDNIARFVIRDDGPDPFYVMEYVSGGSVADWLLKHGPLPVADAVRVVLGAACGIHAAHQHGVIHRDLKPSNLLLSDRTPAAVPKLTDFGMAKDLAVADGPTGSRVILGTPGFLAPEQAIRRSADCDVRTDVWGLAATLYACLTNQPPFDRNAPVDLVATDELVPPSALRPEIPAELNAIICKGLEKRPEDRYQTAKEFADDLQAFLLGTRVAATRRPWGKRTWRRLRSAPRGTVAAIFFAVLSFCALGGVFLRERQPSAARELPAVVRAEQSMDFAMSELKAGHPRTILGETGLPDWYRTPRGVVPMTATPTVADGACVVESGRERCVQLTPPLPIDDYTVTMEVRDLRVKYPFGHVAVGVCATCRTEAVGNVYSHSVQVMFNGPPPVPAGNNTPPVETVRARIAHDLDTQDGKAVALNATDLGELRLPVWERPGGLNGRWRKVEFRVSPAGVDCRWAATRTGDPMVVAKQTRAQLDAAYRTSANIIRRSFPALTFDPVAKWSPAGAVVVSVKDAEVGIRNVRVVPTPK